MKIEQVMMQLKIDGKHYVATNLDDVGPGVLDMIVNLVGGMTKTGKLTLVPVKMEPVPLKDIIDAD